MGSKGFLLLGLLGAIVLLIISSEVAAARDLDETSTAIDPNANDESSGSLDDAKYGDGRGGYNRGHGGGGYGDGRSGYNRGHGGGGGYGGGRGGDGYGHAKPHN